MTNQPSDKPTETPAEDDPPASRPEPKVGPVNTTFEPVTPAAPPSEEPAPGPQPEPAAVVEEGNVPPLLETTPASSDNSSLPGCLRDILLVLVSIVLGAAFALVILLGLNGTLFLNDREKTAALEVSQQTMQSRQDRLEEQVVAQKDAIAAIQSRVGALEDKLQTLSSEQQKQAGEFTALQTRSDEIEQAAEANRQSVQAVQDDQQKLAGQIGALDRQVSDLEGQVDDMADDIEDVKDTAERFDRFVSGLVKLMAEVASEEALTAETGATPEAVSPTASPEAAETPAPAPDPTPVPAEGEASALEIFPSRAPLPTPEPGAGVIYGVVWQDANGNGAPDVGEIALPGVRVVLKAPGGQSLLDMVTGMDGRYAFINMPPGSYQLTAVPSRDRGYTLPEARTVTVDPDESTEVNFGLPQP